MKRRKRRANGSGSSVVGGVVGFVLPPLGIVSLFTGWHPGFWKGATIGSVVALTGAAMVTLFRSARSLSEPAPSSAQSLGDKVHVGDSISALLPSQTILGGTQGIQGDVRVVVTSIGFPTASELQGAIRDGGMPLNFQGQIVTFPRKNVTSLGVLSL